MYHLHQKFYIMFYNYIDIEYRSEIVLVTSFIIDINFG
jgi:hypothetical protein